MQLWLCFLVVLVLSVAGFATGTATIKGTIRAVAAGTSAEPAIIVGATITLTSHASPDKPLVATTDGAGAYIFELLPSGDYTLAVDAKGLSRLTKEIRLDTGALLIVDIDLNATVTESVTVKAEEGLLSSSDVTTSNIVRGETLKEQPLRTDNFQNAIPLTPGAVRDGRGNDYIKGTRTGQSGYSINGADVTDPATGNLAFDIPLEAVSSIQINDNPYAANFGRFTGGVTNVQTKGGGDKFRVTIARFMPALHNILSTKVDSFRPRLTLSGPLVHKKVYFLQSLEFRYSRIYATDLPKPNDVMIQRNINSFTQIDWNLNSRNVIKATAAYFPSKLQNFGLDTFNPASVTPDLKQSGTLFTLSEQAIFRQASFLTSQLSLKTLNVKVLPKSTLPFTVSPALNSGGYFADTRRSNERLEWQETYYSPHFKAFGDHSLTIGSELYRTHVDGQLTYRSIFIRRNDGTLAQRVDFTRATSLDYRYTDGAAFIQDRWVVTPKLTFDYGLRYDRDGVTKLSNLAPRASILLKPFASGRTSVRAGAGLFYDRSTSSAGYFSADPVDPLDLTAIFRHLPRRIVTNYAADGTTVIDGPTLFRMRVDKTLLTPQSFRWSVQVDQTLSKDLTARLGYTHRQTKNDLIVDQQTAAYMLSSRGRSTYDEMQAVMTYSDEKRGRWTGFYVYSRSRGDLNTSDLVFSDTPAIAIRQNAYGRLPFDSPHRLMFYGDIEVSKRLGIRVSPLFEMRSGFAYSAVDQRLDFVGTRNSLSFPTYMSLDIQATKSVRLPFLKDKRARIGLAILNVTDHFNPRDVQNHVTSVNFGKFYNSLGPSIKAKFDMDF